jgi:hypothetical protein
MKFSKLAVIGVVLAASMCLTGTARAESISGSVWAGAAVYPANLSTTPPSGTPTATFTISNPSGDIFDFYSSTDDNLTGFLTDDGINGNTVTYLTGGNQVGSCSGVTLASCGINNDVMEFTGTTYLVKGATYSVTKDDAAYLLINGVSMLDSSSLTDTAALTDYFTWTGATGTQDFVLLYLEVNGGPAVLDSDMTATPEPSSLLLLSTGFLSLAFVIFRMKRASSLVLHS